MALYGAEGTRGTTTELTEKGKELMQEVKKEGRKEVQEGKKEGMEGRTYMVVAPCMREGKKEGRKEGRRGREGIEGGWR
jgi:hypothetical protein